MQVDWSFAGQRTAVYQVIAIDAAPSARESHVPHPHVASEQLCEGVAISILQATVGEGRYSHAWLRTGNAAPMGSRYNVDTSDIGTQELPLQMVLKREKSEYQSGRN